VELIPAIDLKGGRCVRLFKGDFAAETVYSNEPPTVLDRYVALGAGRVHIVDLDGAKDGEQPNREIVMALAARKCAKLQVGGGLRTLSRVKAYLDGGVERAVIGSLAVTAPEEVIKWFREVEPKRIVLALDVRIDASGTPLLTTHGWQDTSTTSLWAAVEHYVSHGLTHVLCTDISRDGALSGPNLGLYREAVDRFPNISWQASGGVASGADLKALDEVGVAAVISGKAMLENKISLEELRPFLPNASFPAST
jgi:phosphoribosylformimino-5-aminoimidazole carboxamide ribotide isomerase